MRNLEAKFRLGDLGLARGQAEAIGFSYRATLVQRDIFLVVPHGKLKLREESDGAWLIHYDRDRDGALELSNYTIAPVADPARTRTILDAALGVITELRKRRMLLLRDNIRLHLDEVDELGKFGEIEAVLREGESPEAHRPAVRQILAALGVAESDLIDASYFELMQPSMRDRE